MFLPAARCTAPPSSSSVRASTTSSATAPKGTELCDARAAESGTLVTFGVKVRSGRKGSRDVHVNYCVVESHKLFIDNKGHKSQCPLVLWTCLRTGARCEDPGRPPDGTQNATSYNQGELVSFRCSRPGFTLSNPHPIQCQMNPSGSGLSFNASAPTCQGMCCIPCAAPCHVCPGSGSGVKDPPLSGAPSVSLT